MTLIKVKSRGTDNISGRRNLIINGDMKVQQRYAVGTTTQATNNSFVGPDRFQFFVNGGGAYTVTQDSGHQADTGHDKALKIAVTTADTSIAAGDFYSFLQRIESNSLQHLQYGTSSAKSLTFSFWVRATKTGTQAVLISKQGTGTDYRRVAEYTINASDTWEHKTITIPGLTASTMANDASTYLQIGWILKYGSTYQGTKDVWTTSGHYTTANAVNNMDSTSNVFYITGVQLEVGDSSSDFEHRSFGEELQLCQRYYYKLSSNSSTDHMAVANGYRNTTSYFTGLVHFPVHMRISPTAMETSGTAGHFDIRNANGTLQAASGVPAFRRGNVWGSSFTFAVAVGGDAGGGTQMRFRHEDGYLAWSAEL